jgi:hypothetical protein
MIPSGARVERRTRWSFSYTGDNTWFWRAVHAAGTQERSRARLETLAECLSDALDHGFVSWTAAAERRHNNSGELIE